LVNKINAEGKYFALYFSLEAADREADKDDVMSIIASEINKALKNSGIMQLSSLFRPYNSLPKMDRSVKISEFLNYICLGVDKEVVVFFDEIDCLMDEPLITFLRQIRLGYNNRFDSPKTVFPRSLALVGLRDIRDYLASVRLNSESRGLASPFNIKKDALTLANFSRREIEELYLQHAEATEFKQTFSDSALDRVWYWSEGQPWLVNALAFETIVKILKKDYCTIITGCHIDQAASELIRRRDVHIDSLIERLKEPRVYRIMDSVFAGTSSFDQKEADVRYCQELGLVVSDEDKSIRPANALYREVMSRTITDHIQAAMAF
jgi:hypothetical protein